MIASPVETGYGCLMILSSIPVYLAFISWKNKPNWFQSGTGKHIFLMFNIKLIFVIRILYSVDEFVENYMKSKKLTIKK